MLRIVAHPYRAIRGVSDHVCISEFAFNHTLSPKLDEMVLFVGSFSYCLGAFLRIEGNVCSIRLVRRFRSRELEDSLREIY